MRSHQVYVAGLPVSRAGVVDAIASLWADAYAGVPRVYVLVNAFSATLRRGEAYQAVLAGADTVPLADGAPLAIGAVLTGQGRVGRCPGPDLLEAAAARAAVDGLSFYLLGGGDGVAERLAARLLSRHPGLQVLGIATPPHGDWTDQAGARLAEDAAASGADIVWVGVSAPKQEMWSARWVHRIGRPIVCVGAAFDFLSGAKPRAPRWMRSAGLEWLFRLASEPRRVWRRYLIGNAVFLLDLIRWGRRAAGRGAGGG
jgi:N-acetylglucosaminyldiphosphoundecaprenol N-acetyl-beta-D-mannosaminyltransferase